ncbi:unnamed protein product [Darwinula stevensoni]|uniref:TLC domain-containing protein n=1 Tax=Darwinula stevensoni TaxID=69355 RepID=A0A7R9AGC6_9CRUS|nr:unnamed protein product [Darwinula stevensoni]CAG0903719.1 unnamed protein product [Darwinula stevensoni]
MLDIADEAQSFFVNKWELSSANPQCGKLLKYFKAPDPDTTVRKFFVIFSATWILTRVIYFPLYVNISATKALLYLDNFYFVNIVLVLLLWSLFLLHLYWTYLLLQVIYGMVFHKVSLVC